MSRSALARRLLPATLAAALVGCGAESDGSRSPITTVESPAQVGTQDFRDFDADHEADGDDDEDGEGHGKDKGKGKEEDKGKPPGHAKKEDG